MTMEIDFSQCRLLVVDDDPIQIESYKDLFSKGNSVHLFFATNGEKALEIIETQKIDVVVSDWKMPKMSGIELLKKSTEINPDIPFIIITGYFNEDILLESIQYRAQFLQKGLSFEILLNAAKRAYEGLCHLRENRHSLLRFKREKKIISLLHEATSIANKCLTFEETLKKFTPLLCKVLDLDACMGYAFSEKEKLFKPVGQCFCHDSATSSALEKYCQTHPLSPDKTNKILEIIQKNNDTIYLEVLEAYQGSPRWKMAMKEGLSYFYLFPIFQSNNLLGIIEVYSKSVLEEYSNQRIMLYLTEIFSLLAQVQMREKKERALLEASRNNWILYWGTVYANSSETFAYASGEVIHLIGNVMEWECGVVYRVSPEGRLDLLKVVENEEKGVSMAPLNVNEQSEEADLTEYRRSFLNQVIESGEPEYLYSTMEMFYDEAQEKYLNEMSGTCGVQGTFVFPVLIDEKVVALLEFFSTKHLEDEQVKTLDNIASVAIQLGFVFQRELNTKALLEKENEIIGLKQNVFSMVVHDLKSPISVLDSMVYCWKNNEELAANTIFMDQLKLAEISLNSLQHLVHEQLTLKQIQDGKFTLNRISTDINELVYSIYSLLLFNFHEDFKFRYEVQPNFPLLFLDKDILRRVLINLVDNAVKHTIEGSVTIQCTYDEKQEKLCIKVKDTGDGISKEHIDHLFDMHFQSKQKLEQKANYGIGLAFCSMAVREMDGDIAVESSLGIGTEFIITILAAKEDGVCKEFDFEKPKGASSEEPEYHL